VLGSAFGVLLIWEAGNAAGQGAPVKGSWHAGSVILDCAEPECPPLVYAPAGSFMMGAAPGETFLPPEPAQPKATPRHRVTFAKPFAIGQHEVTRAEFAAFATATNYQSPARCSITGRTVQILQGRNWKYPTVPQYSDDEPVLCTNYYDALMYTDWLSRRTGHRYRLPSEAEWEYAARAGTDTFYFWGDDPQRGCLYSNVMDLARYRSQGEPISDAMKSALCDSGRIFRPGQEHSPVTAYQPNPWGLYGVSGNGWELASDCWHQDYNGAPSDGSAWIDNPLCNMRITRGDGGGMGSWNHIAHRYPVFADDHRSNTGTFRVVRELDAAEFGAGP
jgi:formylglycine-generating enzyme required for sulfatase activity